MHWMILPLKRYADFSGRSRRLEFWMFVLFNVIVYLLLAIISVSLGGASAKLAAADPTDPIGFYGTLFSGPGIIILLWWLATLIPSIAVGVRRLHDRDMSGWWYLGFFVASFIPLIGIIPAVAFLVIMLLPGTPGPNRFGPDPKGVGNDAGVFE